MSAQVLQPFTESQLEWVVQDVPGRVCGGCVGY